MTDGTAGWPTVPPGTPTTVAERCQNEWTEAVREHDEQRAAWERVADTLASGALTGDRSPAQPFQTHGSFVVAFDELVYKLKRPVQTPFMDYGSPERRKQMCLREVELNRRLAPDIYLSVKGVRAGSSGGFGLCDLDEPDAVEHLVVMRRIERDAILKHRVDQHTVQHQQLRPVGRRLAAFHARAAPVAGAGTAEQVQSWGARLEEAVRTDPRRLLKPALLDAAFDFLNRWFSVNHRLLDQRAADGHVRDGHGDLRLEHVVMTNPVQAIDCLEFDDRLRANDVLADLSFLVMEMQLEGREDLSRVLTDSWAEGGGPVHRRLLWAYAVSRALVRVHVGLRRLGQLEDGFTRKPVEEQTQALLHLAIRLSWRARQPRAILFAGLSGSGKSTISSAIADRWGLERLASDDVRKRMVGIGHDEHAPPIAYEQRVSRDVYERLGRDAGLEVAADRSVVIDATFRRPLDAQAFVRAFRSAGALTDPVTLACVAEPDLLRERIRDRAIRQGSDARPAVLEEQLRDHGDHSVGISNAVELPTAGSPEDILARAEQVVLAATVTAEP